MLISSLLRIVAGLGRKKRCEKRLNDLVSCEPRMASRTDRVDGSSNDGVCPLTLIFGEESVAGALAKSVISEFQKIQYDSNLG